MISITLEEAKKYFLEERLFSDDFLKVDNSKKDQALKMATNQINRLKFSSYSDANKYKYF